MMTIVFTSRDIILRADHPDDIKRGEVCLCFKKSLALRKIELSHITECLLCEVNV